MKGSLPMKNKGKCRVLVAPLDWGLGHATRCIVLVRQLEMAGAEVWLAGSGPQESLLREEFPHLPFLQLEGYGIRYSRKAAAMSWKILRQVPSLLRSIRRENEWLKKMVDIHQFDLVIADNRYGLHHPNIRSIIITHQLNIQTGWGAAADRLLQKWNYKYLEKFNACWIPDIEKDGGLAGELSHPRHLPGIPIEYAGILSRLKPTGQAVKKNKLLIILSGPEPQRSILEEILLKDIAHYNGEATLLRGLPSSRTHIPSTSMISIYNHLDTPGLNKEFSEADLVIARSGYSTIMDAFSLGKKCIFIPTPGQTEQEYLGRYLQQKQWAVCILQKDFILEKALEQAKDFPFRPVDLSGAHPGLVANEMRNWQPAATGNQV